MSSLNSSQPILAYHYSSDEDSPVEVGRMGSDRSIGMSASALCPPSSQPSHTKATSFNIEVVPHHPVKGLRVYPPQEEGQTPPTGRLHHSPVEAENEDLLEYRSLPRSLAKTSFGGTLAEKNSTRLKIAPSGVTLSPLEGSSRRLSTGRASPEMDALDNLLMNRSLHTGAAANQDPCTSDQDGSDVSTCKAARADDEAASAGNRSTNKELSKALEHFSSALRHLQHHTAELECRTKQIEAEFNISKSDVIHLQEATEGIRRDVKKLSDTVTSVSQEASKAKKEYVLQRQETEKLYRDASEALSQAKLSQEEFEVAKVNYESTMKDLHSLVSSIRSSFVIAEVEEEIRQPKKVTLAEAGKSYSENDKRKVDPCIVNAYEKAKQNEDTKKVSSKETASQKGGYQSFFQRPSSLIYGLASKSANKSFSSKKGRENKQVDTNKHEGEDKKKSTKQIGSLENKQKGEKHTPNSLERKSKPFKKESTHEYNKEDTRQQQKNKATSSDKSKTSDNESGTKRRLLTLETLPSMDERHEPDDKKSNTASGISHVSINVNSQSHAFHLEKSLSSPTVPAKFADNRHIRPNVLNFPPSPQDGDKLHSNTPSPDSPISPAALPYSLTGNQSSLAETKYILDSLFPTQPPRTSPSVIRQSPIPSIPEETAGTRPRQGVFAIAKQKSSPNIPLQRQSSAPVFPLQRQRSLGTVPEEGQLPRQASASLMSVPEDRPVVDQTLPISPSSSLISFAVSPSPSGDRLDSFRERPSVRNSMELVTGPVISGSLIQESCIRQLPPSSEFELSDPPIATSSLKKSSERKKSATKGVVV